MESKPEMQLVWSPTPTSIATGIFRVRQILNEAEPVAAPKRLGLSGAIRANYAYLDIPDTVIDRFVRDFESAHGKGAATGMPITPPVLGQFLMSTDFFPNGADEQRTLNYIAFYSAYVSPCYNPLSRPPVG